MGDSVDNVPGVPGIGPKTATQLIQQYGDLETVLASTDEITKPKLKQNLIDHADNARLQPRAGAAGLRRHLPRADRGPGAEGHSARAAAASSLTTRGSRRCSPASGGGGGRSRPAAPATMTSWRQWSRSARRRARAGKDRGRSIEVRDGDRRGGARPLDRRGERQGYVAIDTETDCIDCVIAKLAGISLATEPNRACYIPVGHVGGDLFPTRRNSCRCSWCWQAEAAARGSVGPEDRAQPQV